MRAVTDKIHCFYDLFVKIAFNCASYNIFIFLWLVQEEKPESPDTDMPDTKESSSPAIPVPDDTKLPTSSDEGVDSGIGESSAPSQVCRFL